MAGLIFEAFYTWLLYVNILCYKPRTLQVDSYWILNQSWNGFQLFSEISSTFDAFAFLFCFRLLVKRELLFHILILIYMHDLYKYIIYKLATPSGIVHWINLDKNFYIWLLCSYKTGHQLIGLLSTVKEKIIIENTKNLLLVQKLIYCGRPAIYFVIWIFAQLLGNFLYFLLTCLPLKNTLKNSI